MAADGNPAKPRETNDAPAHSLALDLLRPRLALALRPTRDDAALIALCAQHDALFAEADDGREFSDAEAEDNRVNGLVCRASGIAETIVTMRATTPAGIAALARTAAVAADGMLIDNDTDPLLKMLFRDSLALGAAHTVPAATSPMDRATSPRDADLIAACAAFDDLERQRNATFTGQDLTSEEEAAADAVRDRLYDEQDPLFDRILALPATTLDGLQAKVRTLTLENLEIMKDGPGDRTDCLLTSICRDVLNGISEPPAPNKLAPLPAHPLLSPDAELLALHDRFVALEAQVRGLYRTIPDDDAREVARLPLGVEQDAILNNAWNLTATTLEGHRARARMLVAWDGEIKRQADERDGIDSEMLWLLVRDLLGADHADALQSNDAAVYEQAFKEGLCSVVLPANPDAAIIALCDQTADA